MDANKKMRLTFSILAGVALGIGLHQSRSLSQCPETTVFSMQADKWLEQFMPTATSVCDQNCLSISKKRSGEAIVVIKERSSWKTIVPIDALPNMRYHVALHFRTVADELNLPVQTAISLNGLNGEGRLIERKPPRVGNWQPRKGWADWKDVIPLDGEFYEKSSFSDNVSKLQVRLTVNVLGSASQTEIEHLEVKATEKSCAGKFVGNS